MLIGGRKHLVVKIVKQSIVAPDCDRYLLENPPAEYERLQTGGAPFLNGITVSSNSDIYLAATGCRCVLKLDEQGRVSTVLKAESPWSPTGLTYTFPYTTLFRSRKSVV